MRRVVLLCLLACLAVVVACGPKQQKRHVGDIRMKKNDNEADAIAFLERYNTESSRLLNKGIILDWAYNTNITDANAEASTAASLELQAFSLASFNEALEFDSTNFSEDTQRQLKSVGAKQLPEAEQQTLSEVLTLLRGIFTNILCIEMHVQIILRQILSNMSRIYGSGQVCWEDGQCSVLEGTEDSLSTLFATSTDEPKLRYAWEQWRTNVGRPMKPYYEQYVELKNQLAVIRNYTDYGHEMRSRYEIDDFELSMEEIYNTTLPYYLELHAYVRRKLYDTYGPEVVDLEGPIPAHLLGDMWGRFWNNIYNLTEPYPGLQSVDPTPQMVAQGYTPERMFRQGDAFYQSMGLKAVPDTFYELSMIEKPQDGREVVCHPTAWDFFDGQDYRIKMCTVVSFDDFLVIHHEMGHIQYFMQYSDLPTVYRDGANDGFHEAIGELMSMAVSTPKHLETIGLIDEVVENPDLDINFLLKTSFGSLSTLPFHYVMDLWRWRAFRGEYPDNQWNDEFWKLKESLVGVKAPVERTPEDLDPPALFHISGDYDMMRYFTRTILQFQFFESLCEASGHQGPIYKCDFSGSTAAGDRLAALLRMGRSKPWPDALEELTGQREMDVNPLLNYFAPLYNWLQTENKRLNNKIGWKPSNSFA
ncbi:unnamed protein product [Notodromas monacha]|uniref:Angiotensin-converting enzyme n=1 Tax=Notodromas monacha TaxID=399045 RepID=A0A7R9BC28_9CRUS|nr:unnamed protein product [Notodromas monacha]CAG0912459.1 unnamed protein product [Notodromas monacha]